MHCFCAWLVARALRQINFLREIIGWRAVLAHCQEGLYAPVDCLNEWNRLMNDDVLAGKRVLLVEDDALVAMLLEDTLIDCGCVVVGPVAKVAEALVLAEAGALDAAIMDVNVGGEKAYPVAEALDARGIPFLLVSGYGQSAIPSGKPGWRACAKPFKNEDLVRMLREQVVKVSGAF
jgi:CheY-like chemotaxis protein